MTAAFKKFMLQTALVSGTFLIAFFIAVLPKWLSDRQLGAQVQATFYENQNLQTLILTAKNSGDRLEIIQKKLEDYKKSVLRQEDLSRVLDELGSQAQAADLKVLSLQALDEPRRLPGEIFLDENLEIQNAQIVLKTEGRYSAIRQYFKQLETMPYAVVVQNMLIKNISPGVLNEREEPLLTLDVTLEVMMRFPKSKPLKPGGAV